MMSTTNTGFTKEERAQLRASYLKQQRRVERLQTAVAIASPVLYIVLRGLTLLLALVFVAIACIPLALCVTVLILSIIEEALHGPSFFLIATFILALGATYQMGVKTFASIRSAWREGKTPAQA